MKNRSDFFLLIITFIFLAGLVGFFANSTRNKTSNKVTNTQQRLIQSNYSVSEIDDEWSLLVSKDFNISLRIPKNTVVNKGFGFDPSNPKAETAQLGLEIPRELANLVIAINTGFLNSKEIHEIAENYTKSSNPPSITYTEPKEKIINGMKGYEIYSSSINGTTTYHLIVKNGDRYIDLWYFYPWHGTTNQTYKEESIAKEIVSTFRLLN